MPAKKAKKRAPSARKRASDARETCPHPPSKKKFLGYASICDPNQGGCGKVFR